MTAEPIDAVLPVSLSTRYGEDRLRLLCESLTRYVAPQTLREVYVICGRGEGAKTLDILSDCPFTFAARVVESQDLLGESPPGDWHREQLAKLAVACYATDFYLVIDPNSLLCGPLRLDDLIRDGRARVRLYARRFHEAEYRAAAGLLGGCVGDLQEPAMGVGPQVLSRDVVLCLQKTLARKHSRPWLDVLTSTKGWNVPSLYWTAARELQAVERLHFADSLVSTSCFSPDVFENWTPRFERSAFAIAACDQIEPRRIRAKAIAGGILAQPPSPGPKRFPTKIAVPYFQMGDCSDFETVLRIWDAFYAQSGTTLPVCLLTDGKTQPPTWWRHDVATFSEEPVELRNWGQKTDWLKANAFAVCGRTLVLDADCLPLSSLNEIERYDGDFLMSASRRRWWGYGGNSRLHQCGVMLIDSAAPAEYLRRAWTSSQYASQANAANHGEMILADYFESLGREPLPIEWNTEIFRLGQQDAVAPGRNLLDRIAVSPATKIAHFSSYGAKQALKEIAEPIQIRRRLQRRVYREPQPFAIVARGRDGSTLLQSSLDAHPEIDCQEEALSLYRQPKWWREAPSAARYLTVRVFHRNFKPDVKAVGFKLLGYQGRESPVDDVRSFLRRIGAKIVLLERRNRVANYVSYRLAQTAGTWRSSDDRVTRTETLRVEPSVLLRELQAIDDSYLRSRREFESFPNLTICYEDLARDFDATIGRVCEFLSVTRMRLPQRTRKLERRRLRDVLENYEEVQRGLSGTPYRSMLGDGESSV